MAADEERFTALYHRHYGHVERFVRRRVAEAAVRDVVAEVFLVAWRRWGEMPADSPLPWLYGVARYTVANELRSVRRARSLREMAEAAERDTAQPDIAVGVSERLALAEVFDALPAASQEILRLVAWEGLSIREAAQVAGCGVPAATMRLHRARAQARAALRTAAPALERKS